MLKGFLVPVKRAGKDPFGAIARNRLPKTFNILKKTAWTLQLS